MRAPILALKDVRLADGPKMMFDGVDLGLEPRVRACLVGRAWAIAAIATPSPTPATNPNANFVERLIASSGLPDGRAWAEILPPARCLFSACALRPPVRWPRRAGRGAAAA